MSHSAGRAIAIAFALFFSAVSGAFATVITNWGGDYVTTYTELNGGTPVSPTTASKTYTYSTTVAKSPAGPTFYGAFSLSNSIDSGTAPSFMANRFGIANGGAADSLRFGGTASSGTLTMRGLVFFNKADFLNGGATQTVTLNSLSSFSITNTSFTGNNREVRMAVYALVAGDWAWYLSATSSANTVATFSITNAASQSWGLYSINDSTAPLNGAPVTFTTAGSAFESITSAGYYFNTTQTGTANTTFFVSNFNADVLVVPEPSTALMILLPVGAWLLRRRRSRSL